MKTKEQPHETAQTELSAPALFAPVDSAEGHAAESLPPMQVSNLGQAALSRRPPTAMDLLSVALQNNAAIDVIERLAALQEKALARDAEIEFNDSLNRVQQQIKRVAPDLDNPQTRSKYASYAAIDRKIRPIYSEQGFSLSFDTADCPRADHIRVICYVSKAGHTRRYQMDMASDGKGAKGNDVMSKTHAEGAAMSYGMRYLVKAIFNIAVGEDDDDGNLTNGELSEKIEWIQNAKDAAELRRLFEMAYAQFESSPNAIRAIVEAKNKRKKELS